MLVAASALSIAAASVRAQQLPPVVATPTPRAPSTPRPPTTTPSATRPPVVTPAPTPAPTAEPSQVQPDPPPVQTPLPPAPDADQTPQPSDRPSATRGPASPQARVIPPGVTIPVIPRTPGRNTVKLVQTLERATRTGMALDQALVEGMGRFPVAGVAWYSDDWMAPRFTPFFHLHEGLDIFADFGTPIRSPDRGIVSRTTSGPIGGTGLWMTARDGTQYYFAHLQAYAPGMEAGVHVEVGTVLAFAGDSGNAQGGAPHLHFEIHRGGRPIPPKPTVDRWLLEAQNQAAAWVDARVSNSAAERRLARSEHALAPLVAGDAVAPVPIPEYSLLLALLDPVGGPAGVFPRLTIVPSPSTAVSSRLLEELIRQRVDGSVLLSLAGKGAERDAGG